MAFTTRPACGRGLCHIREDARVLPFRARDFRRPQGCPTRVQGLGVGGQLSNPVQSNVKSGENSPYRTYPASTLVPEQIPPPLDSARNEIGQLSNGIWGWFWTMPATKSDSCPTGWDEAGRRFRRTGGAAGEAVEGTKAVIRVRPYKARGFRQWQGCHTRVQGLGVGGGLSNAVQLNLKSGEIGPYRRYSASNWVPEQLPAPLDSARNEIGQCATFDSGQCWTAPATESDSLSSRLESGRAGWLAGPGDGVWRARAGGADG